MHELEDLGGPYREVSSHIYRYTCGKLSLPQDIEALIRDA